MRRDMLEALRGWIISVCLAVLRWLDADEIRMETDLATARAELDTARADVLAARHGLDEAESLSLLLVTERDALSRKLRTLDTLHHATVAALTQIEKERDILRVTLADAVPLPDEVLAMLPDARLAVAYAEQVGHSARHKHAVAYRALGQRHPGATKRDVALAVVVAHRRLDGPVPLDAVPTEIPSVLSFTSRGHALGQVADVRTSARAPLVSDFVDLDGDET